MLPKPKQGELEASRAENLYEMAVRKRLDERKRAWSFCMASREGSFLNFLPSETLRDDLQKVST
jgi:hypothetical protein